MSRKAEKLAAELLKEFQGPYVDPIDAARQAASHVFRIIMDELGVETAQAIFERFKRPKARQRQRRKNADVLSALDVRGNVNALAREMAGENPTPERLASVTRNLRRMNAKRRRLQLTEAPERPAALKAITSLSYNKNRNLFRDDATGKLYKPNGTAVKRKRSSRKKPG